MKKTVILYNDTTKVSILEQMEEVPDYAILELSYDDVYYEGERPNIIFSFYTTENGCFLYDNMKVEYNYKYTNKGGFGIIKIENNIPYLIINDKKECIDSSIELWEIK